MTEPDDFSRIMSEMISDMVTAPPQRVMRESPPRWYWRTVVPIVTIGMIISTVTICLDPPVQWWEICCNGFGWFAIGSLFGQWQNRRLNKIKLDISNSQARTINSLNKIIETQREMLQFRGRSQ